MRIRTVKPQLFKHEELFDAEEESGLPLRLVYIGLFCCCDREGRFKWKERSLKSDIMPFDEIDFSASLQALIKHGFLSKYEVDDVQYGCIPSFLTHQVINNRETASVIPANPQLIDTKELPRVDDASSTRKAREEHAACARTSGREGKGIGKGKEGKDSPLPQASLKKLKEAGAELFNDHASWNALVTECTLDAVLQALNEMPAHETKRLSAIKKRSHEIVMETLETLKEQSTDV